LSRTKKQRKVLPREKRGGDGEPGGIGRRGSVGSFFCTIRREIEGGHIKKGNYIERKTKKFRVGDELWGGARHVEGGEIRGPRGEGGKGSAACPPNPGEKGGGADEKDVEQFDGGNTLGRGGDRKGKP